MRPIFEAIDQLDIIYGGCVLFKQGTGWVPDFPDVKDYTLQSEQIKTLTSQVQTDRFTKSIENLTGRITQALRILSDSSVDRADREGGHQAASQELERLIEELDQNAAGGIFLIPAKINKILKPGMSDPEILKIKKCLHSIYPDIPELAQSDYEFNPFFDRRTQSLIEDFQVNMGLKKDGIVDGQTMNTLWDAHFTKESLKAGRLSYSIFLNYQEAEEVQSRIQDLEDTIKQVSEVSNQSSNVIEAFLNNTITKMQESRDRLKELLEYRNVRLSPIVSRWLNSSDECIVQEILQGSTDIEASRGAFHTVDSRVSSAVDQLIKKLKNIPCFLYHPPRPEDHRELIEDIEPPISEQFCENLLQKLIPKETLDELMQMVTQSEFYVVSPDTDLSYYDETSFIFDQRDNAADRLIKQLQLLGFTSGERRSTKWDRALSLVEKFNEIHDLKQIVVYDGHEYPATYHFYSNDVGKRLVNAVQEKIKRLVFPITKFVFYIVFPLGKFSNIDRAVEEGWGIFQRLLKTASDKDGVTLERLDQELDQLLSAMIKAKLNVEIEVFEMAEVADRAAYLKTLFLTTIRESKAILDSEPDSQIHRTIGSLINPWRLAMANLSLEESAESKTSLEILEVGNESTPQADLHLPVVWSLGQKIKALKANSKLFELIYLSLPEFSDLSLWCSSIENQGSLNSCTAQAGVALTEYFAKKAFGKYTDVSALFLYKAARNLMQRQGDTGASVRETMKAMVLFGIPPEEYWPYDANKYDQEPSSFCYSFAQNYQALKYFRLDHAGIANNALLVQIKAVLVAGFPCMFGFTIYTSIREESNVAKGVVA